MAKKQILKKKTLGSKHTGGGNFNLPEKHYEQLDSFEVYATEKKVTKIFGVRNKNTSQTEPYLKSRTRSKTPYGWRYLYGIDLLSFLHISKFIKGLLSIARKLGWKTQEPDDIKQIKTQLRESEETIVHLEETNQELREKHGKLMHTFREKQQQILSSRVGEFKTDVESFSRLISDAKNKKISEQKLQNFLYTHPWFFGTEYVNAEPQKLRGAHSKFDFYLERFNKTNDIVEIKLLSEPIVNKDNSLSAKVSQAVDQIINYMESSQAAAHSTEISDEEGIHELRPRGIVIIGNDSSPRAIKKLHKWNYQLAHISILTYMDVLDRAKSVLKHLQPIGETSSQSSE